MKTNLSILVFLFLIGGSCSKETESVDHKQIASDNGCIEKITIPASSQGTLTNADYNLILTLFSSNGISNPNFRFTRTYYRDSVQTYNGIHNFRNVIIIQYTNGLPIFRESLNYSFKNGIFESYSGQLTNGTSLNTISTLSLGQLRKLFIDDIELFDHKGKQYKDSCFKAEFGYFNLNAGTGNTSENLVKAWHLTPNFYSYPEAYYRDDTGERIYYFNGIVY
jgi:hypothetical protein